MNLLLSWRLWAVAILAGFLALTHITAYRSGRHAIQARWDASKVATERAAQEQATRNRELQRAAELRYVVQREAQDSFFVTTVKEVHELAAPLSACAVPDDLRVRVNQAIACAVGNPASACGAADEVPATPAPAGRGLSQ